MTIILKSSMVFLIMFFSLVCVLPVPDGVPSESEAKMVYLLSLFRDQIQENETMEWYSDYIENRLQTGLKSSKSVSQQRGANRKGESTGSTKCHMNVFFFEILFWIILKFYGLLDNNTGFA